MPEKDLKALFIHQLKDTYSAEKAILKALPDSRSSRERARSLPGRAQGEA
jgi:ferritin-like metal-binding protein YciE